MPLVCSIADRCSTKSATAAVISSRGTPPSAASPSGPLNVSTANVLSNFRGPLCIAYPCCGIPLRLCSAARPEGACGAVVSKYPVTLGSENFGSFDVSATVVDYGPDLSHLTAHL